MYTSPDWTVAFQAGETGELARLLPIRVQQCEIEGILKPYKIIDFVDLTEDAAFSALMSALQNSPPRLKQAPRFPGYAATVFGTPPDRNPLFIGRLAFSSQALFLLAPEGFIEYCDQQEIVSISFNTLGRINIEYDEDDMPWLELAYLDGTTGFWSQRAYFGRPEYIMEKISQAFLAYTRKYHMPPAS
jgi:hypothetical protein